MTNKEFTLLMNSIFGPVVNAKAQKKKKKIKKAAKKPKASH